MEDVKGVQVAHGAGNLSACCSATPPNQLCQGLAAIATKVVNVCFIIALQAIIKADAGVLWSDSNEEGALKAWSYPEGWHCSGAMRGPEVAQRNLALGRGHSGAGPLTYRSTGFANKVEL